MNDSDSVSGPDSANGTGNGSLTDSGRIARGLAALAGLAVAGYGIAGLVTHARATRPTNSLAWLLTGIVAHDAVVVPVIALIGLVLSRAVPRPYRAVTQGALIVSGSVILASLPLWRGYGGSPGNPSVNALPYGRNLLIVLGGVWAVALMLMAYRWLRSRLAG